MKREEIKATLDKIQPKEELICATLRKVETQKNKKRVSSFWQTRGYRYAMAVCTLMLLCGVGLLTWKLPDREDAASQPQGNPVSRSVRQDEAEEEDVSLALHVLETNTVWLQGVLCEYTLCEVTEEETASGIIAHALLTIQPENDTGKEAELYLYEEDKLHELKDAVHKEWNFLLEQNGQEETVWKVLDFLTLENE